MRTLIVSGAIVAVAAVFVAVVFVTGRESSLARAAENLDGQNVRMHVTLGYVQDGEEFSMVGTSVQSADGSQARMDVDTLYEGQDEPLPQTYMSIGDDLWVGGKGFEALLPEGKRWIYTVDATAMPQTMTLSEFADFLTEADGIEDKGETVVRGTPATHYQGRVSIRDLAEKSDGAYAKRVAAALRDEDVTLPLEAWISGEGKLVRMALTVDGGKDSFSMTADILEYGASTATIKAPPKDETISEAEFDALTEG